MDMKQKYSSKVAHDILKKFHQKGWNLYNSDDISLKYISKNSDDVIRNNLAYSLKINTSYVLLPAAENPKDPGQVRSALEALAQKLNHEMPTIRFGWESHPLTGITLYSDMVKLHTPYGTIVDYPNFMKALDSIVQTAEGRVARIASHDKESF